VRRAIGPIGVSRPLAMVMLAIPFLCGASSAPRGMVPDDPLRLAAFGEAAIAPSGALVAYVRVRPKASSTMPMRIDMDGDDRSDIWIGSVDGGPSRNITNGETHGAGYWAPVWSPDGQRLAMTSTRDGNVRLWIWDKASDNLQLTSARAVEYRAGRSRFSKPVWLSNTRLLYARLPEGQRPVGYTIQVQSPEVAIAQWPRAWRGVESTASVITSGDYGAGSYEQRAQGDLVVFDATTGSEQVIATGNFGDLQLSPGGRFVSLLKQVDVLHPDPQRRLQNRILQQYELRVLSLAGEVKLIGTTEFKDVVPGSVRWSPDAKYVAAVGWTPDSPPWRVYRYEIAAETLKRLPGPTFLVRIAAFNPTGIVWSLQGDLLIRAQPLEPSNSARVDWWAQRPDGTSRNLTASMSDVPAQLVRHTDGQSFAGVADGRLWRLTTRGEPPQAVTLPPAALPLASLAWPDAESAETGQFDTAIVNARGPGQDGLWIVTLASGQARPLATPALDARLVTFDAATNVSVHTLGNREGTFLWTSHNDAHAPHLLADANTWLPEVAESEKRLFQYRSLAGEELTARLLLPVGYDPARRYPMVTWVYAGSVFGKTGMRWAALNDSSSLNPNILAAHGYVVLFPSMPMTPDGVPGDHYSELSNGVLPAVDKAIGLGIADPTRVAVMGHSYGGYSTYGLITQTDRFRAAVSLAGFCDLVSLYGVFDPQFRYQDSAREWMMHMLLAEAGQDGLGNPPWKDWARYLRNSPLTYVDHINTPVMIIQGDQDYVPIEQGEEMFTALYRQNRPASFVRYWGEGHGIESPANIRDMWTRVFAWLDRWLA